MKVKFQLLVILLLLGTSPLAEAANDNNVTGPIVQQSGDNEMTITQQIAPPPLVPDQSQNFVVSENSGCCSENCRPDHEENCPNSGGNCCPPADLSNGCDGSNSPNVCACHPECPLTCAVGGTNCYDMCYRGINAPVPLCDSICEMLVASLMAICQSAIDSHAGGLSFDGVNAPCPNGGHVTSCEPIHIGCSVLACSDCFYCAATGLCGVRFACEQDDLVTPTPTVTPTGSPEPLTKPIPVYLR